MLSLACCCFPRQTAPQPLGVTLIPMGLRQSEFEQFVFWFPFFKPHAAVEPVVARYKETVPRGASGVP
jgi:hypothetical protein